MLSFWMTIMVNSLNGVKNYVKCWNILPLIQMMEMKLPIILNPSRESLVSQTKYLLNANIYVKGSLGLEVLKKDSEINISSINALYKSHINQRKALILTEHYNTSLDVFNHIRINQQVYLHETSTCNLFEIYAIAGRKISRKLGTLDKDMFIWNTNVEPRFINITI